MYTPTQDKSDDMKDSFYEELESVFDQIPKYYLKMFIGDLMKKDGEKMLSTQQSGMRVYM
jgi:hypothetical protein